MGYAPPSTPRALIREFSDRGSLVGPDAVAYLREQADLSAVSAVLTSLADLPMVVTVPDLVRMEEMGDGATDPTGAAGATDPADGGAGAQPAPTVRRADAGLAVPKRSTTTPPPSASTQGVRRPGTGTTRRSTTSAPSPPAPPSPPSPASRPDLPDVGGTADRDGGDGDAPSPHDLDDGADAPPAPPLRVVRDISGASTCAGELTDFTRYFNARYEEIKAMLRRRPELSGAVPIQALEGRDEVKVIGMVTEVRSTKNGHRLIELEDDTGICAVLASAQDPEALAKTSDLLEDEVVGVVGHMAKKGDLLILRDLVRPDVPLRNDTTWADEPCGVLFISDTHVGSRTFMEDAWERLVGWLDGTAGTEEQRRLAERVRYVVLSGDLVEGIGIYPGQQEELAITDVYDQYEETARLLSGIPGRIETFLMPGNHDAVRPAEPQPTFPEPIRDLFPDDRFTFVGNPCTLEIGGVEVLAYHGRSFDDFITRGQGLEYSKPLEIMREMLRRRHLCPMYGGKTPVAPEAEDHLIVRDVPDVFVTGHGHSCAMGRYNGITLVNASTWQSQTPFQRMMRYEPDPAKACFVDVGTGEQRILSFA